MYILTGTLQCRCIHPKVSSAKTCRLHHSEQICKFS